MLIPELLEGLRPQKQAVKSFLRLPYSVFTHWQTTLLPLIYLIVTLGVGTLGPYWTLFSLGSMPIVINILVKYLKVKNSSGFYFAFTVYSILLAHAVFEKAVISSSITSVEYYCNISLWALMIFLIYITKSVYDQPVLYSSTLPSSTSSTRPLAPTRESRGYDFCRKCQKTIFERDHHCVWLNTCIGKSNKILFIATLAISFLWLVFTVLLNLTSMCYPTYLFRGFGYNDGSSAEGRWFLIPTVCPEIYEHRLSTISFVVTLYCAGAAFLVFLVLIHQLRLLYKGVSYIEYKYGVKK